MDNERLAVKMSAANQPEQISFRRALTFDAVGEARREVRYDEIAGHYSGPMSKHPVISVKGHPELIWIRPDIGVGSIANPVAFAFGKSPQQIPWQDVRRSLMGGYLPIVTSTWNRERLNVKQVSFASLIHADEVKSGHEKQVALVQMRFQNSGVSGSLSESLWLFVPCLVAANGILPFPYNTYDLFEVMGSLPVVQGEGVRPHSNVVSHNGTPIAIIRTDTAILTRKFNNCYCFTFSLEPGESKAIELVVTSSEQGLTAAELDSVERVDFRSALQRRRDSLEALLASGMQIQVPEEIVNQTYKAQILHSQSQLVQAADRDYRLIVQGFQGVWPWEVMKFTVHWDSIGYHDDVRKCLEYFLQIQGRFPPHGNFKKSDGTFGGTIAFEESGWEKDESTIYGQLARQNSGKEGEFPNWMNGTGAMLYAFATHYWYTRDADWLSRVAPSLIRACNWIIDERQATKQQDLNGNKVLHYGLLPVGRAYDTAEEAIRKLEMDGELANGQVDDRLAPLDTYYPCWTDSYSSQGLTNIAAALAEIEHPESGRLVEEAKAYHDDLVQVMKLTRTSDRDLPPYRERLYRPAAWAEFATGALAYWDTAFAQATDEAFVQLESYMKKKWNRGVLGLTGGMEKNGDPHGTNSFYVNFSEDIWHRGWLFRGEIEKALLAFYSMLIYGMDRDTLATVERFHLSDPRYAPFFMDTSASARVCGLIRQSVLLEEGSILHLLAGVPRAWMNAGQKIQIMNGVTKAANLDLDVESRLEAGKISVRTTIRYLRDKDLQAIHLRVPHPQRTKMTGVRIDGKGWTGFYPGREMVEFPPKSGVTEIEVLY